MTTRYRVPANLLLCGEYAITEQGGLGIACAVNRYLHVEVSDSASLVVTGRYEGTDRVWNFARSGSVPSGDFVSDVIAFVGRYLAGLMRGSGTTLFLPALRIDLDSSELQSEGERKIGLGSSATVAVALTQILCEAAQEEGLSPDAFGSRTTPGVELALSAHRYAQGGAGSGYDVLTSWHAGTGLFTGGDSPRWTPATVPLSQDVQLFPGPQSVSSRDAVSSYRAWKQRRPTEAGTFLSRSNELVRKLVSVSDPATFTALLREYRDLQIDLGRQIGVSAAPVVHADDITLDPQSEDYLLKALGAGNELIACLPLNQQVRSRIRSAHAFTVHRLPGTPVTTEDDT